MYNCCDFTFRKGIPARKLLRQINEQAGSARFFFFFFLKKKRVHGETVTVWYAEGDSKLKCTWPSPSVTYA